MNTVLLILAILVVAAIILPLIGILLRLVFTAIAGVLMLCLSVVAGVGFIALAIAGITLAVLHQVWGAANIGWAIALAGLFGLLTFLGLLRGLAVNTLGRFAAIRQWWDRPQKRQQPTNGETPRQETQS